MKDRLAQMEVVFVGKYTALMGVRRERLAKERFKLASTLYYHVMEIMLRLVNYLDFFMRSFIGQFDWLEYIS